METLTKQDVIWLKIVEYFAYDKSEVVLARYILTICLPIHGTRRFSEHFLMETTGWTEYMIRRALGNWANMDMAAKHTIIESAHTRLERCQQEWVLQTHLFVESLNERICWMRCHMPSPKGMGCACDSSKLFPNDDCTELLCQNCGQALSHENRTPLTTSTLYDAYLLSTNDPSRNEIHTVWQCKPVVPQSLATKRLKTENNEDEENMWE
jgi:hypothetical protein